jgi:predicted transport protein
MSKFGMYSEKPKISIDEHISKLDEPMQGIFQEIRSFVLSLGSNVVEEVRPHRIVYAKSFIFRMFLDIEPMGNALTISVKMEPRGTPNKIIISSKEQLPSLKDMVQKAYAKI